ncbi:unnamed protein product [Spirodela intermedia]|uniref:Uncharacterized protein n=1 Tax=Spirodela intermedia TaxID=51605 RepID=A0A7I8IYR1_SPIIN|nr:unnamed protein product [Spirodela intermedia]CAA6662152.1 unnamed protein product [Spirodela intermedia]
MEEFKIIYGGYELSKQEFLNRKQLEPIKKYTKKFTLMKACKSITKLKYACMIKCLVLSARCLTYIN